MTQPLFQCQKFSVVAVPVAARDGGTRAYEVVRSQDAVVVLPLLDDGRPVFIRNQRHAVGRTLWELPAGTLDVEGEAPAAAAARELEEETGYAAAELAPCGAFYSTPGFVTERIHAFRASGLSKVGQDLGETERIEVHPLEWDEVWAMVRDGRIEDGKTLAALLYHRLGAEA